MVDDDAELAAMIAAFLSKHGYVVHTAPDGPTATALLSREKVALVITDLMMPHMDGIQFTEELHRLPGYRDVPVILMTAYPADGVTEKGLRRGVGLTLTKPLDLQRLLDLVGFAASQG